MATDWKKVAFDCRILFWVSEKCLEKKKLIKIYFRDLKLSNILLDGDGHIRFIDFGSSKRTFIYQFIFFIIFLVLENGKKTSGVCGTPHYMAPEIILGFFYDFYSYYESKNL